VKILGIETTCDETAASVVEDGRTALSNVISSQAAKHARYGGVVPEVAARSHMEAIIPVIDASLKEANCNWADIDGIAVAAGPGLLGSLLVGTLAARTLAETKQKPLYAVNHVVAHTYANFLIDPQPTFPLLSLSVSGGHSHLIWFDEPLKYRLLGVTRDDAAGEAFDKVAAMLGLPYPGGPSIAKAALDGNNKSFVFTKPKLDNPYDFSFSGLKTGVLRQLQQLIGEDHTYPSTMIAERLTAGQVADMAASFQQTVADILTDNLERAYHELKPASVVIAGGVAANLVLRETVSERLPVEMNYAPFEYCTDNGAMIAALGYQLAKAGKYISPDELETNPSLPV
jgi:N6-L-threonylcarbamoyladenine synthase